jgi:hypothetical protein
VGAFRQVCRYHRRRSLSAKALDVVGIGGAVVEGELCAVVVEERQQ